MNSRALENLLRQKVKQYNQPSFIASDPISIPHRFSRLQDKEIIGLIAATLAWGQRVTILHNCQRIIQLMDNEPYDFVLHFKDKDLQRFEGFVHRTFNTTDLMYFLHFFQWYYRKYDSLEEAFTAGMKEKDHTTEGGLVHFRKLFFSLPFVPPRTHKHVASPERNSACKRLNMFLRWMVRNDETGVDFGLWKRIKPAQLQCPLDVHSGRSARELGLLTREQDDWKAVCELTDNLRRLDAHDPVQFDFALYGMGVFEK